MTAPRRGMRRKEGIAAATNQALDVFKPTMDRAVPTQVVPCPVCHAPIGARCVPPNGNAESCSPHGARRVMALRAEKLNGTGPVTPEPRPGYAACDECGKEVPLRNNGTMYNHLTKSRVPCLRGGEKP